MNTSSEALSRIIGDSHSRAIFAVSGNLAFWNGADNPAEGLISKLILAQSVFQNPPLQPSQVNFPWR